MQLARNTSDSLRNDCRAGYVKGCLSTRSTEVLSYRSGGEGLGPTSNRQASRQQSVTMSKFGVLVMGPAGAGKVRF